MDASHPLPTNSSMGRKKYMPDIEHAKESIAAMTFKGYGDTKVTT